MSDSILDHPLIAERYFFPRPVRFDDPFWVDLGEAKLACYFSKNHPGAKTVVHFHGNGEIVCDYFDDFLARIYEMGLNCFLAEYRGYGMSTGRPALAGMLGDAERIIDSIGEPPENLILFGRSIGSLYAIHCASRFPQVAGLIIESGIADVLDRLLFRVQPEELGATLEEIQAAVNKDLDNERKLAAFHGPALIMHTRHDGLLDLSHAERLHAWTRGSKELKVFEKGDHNSILFMNYHEYFKLVEEFVNHEGSRR
ncbi:MAG: alpha/beta hydrolase [Planctomycetota bacterium]|jgi:pimeloyl-ACP methyl ester carboxylesterase